MCWLIVLWNNQNFDGSGNNNFIVIFLTIFFIYTYIDDFSFKFIACVIHSEASPFKADSFSLLLYFFHIMWNTEKQTHWTTLWIYKYFWINPYLYTDACYW